MMITLLIKKLITIHNGNGNDNDTGTVNDNDNDNDNDNGNGNGNNKIFNYLMSSLKGIKKKKIEITEDWH